MNDYISILDTNRFGFPIAKLSGKFNSPGLIVRDLKKIDTKLIIARIDFSNLTLVNELERIGFQIKDIQITYNFNFDKRIDNKSNNEFILRRFTESDIPKIIKIAENSFNNYGHYFADERLDRNKCLEIYVDWTEKCCYNKSISDFIVIAEKNSEVIGFLALKIHNDNIGKYATGVLGAVSPEYRNSGVFREINLESLYLAKSWNLSRIENNVLITNFSVNKTYRSLNYDVVRVESTLHFWYD